MNATTYRRLGELLVSAGAISNLQLSIALADQRVTNRRLGSILVDRGFCDEAHIAASLAEQYGYPLVDLNAYRPNPEALQLLGCDLALQYEALPLSIKDSVVLIALADPIDILATDQIAAQIKLQIAWAIAPQGTLQSTIRKFYGLDEEELSTSFKAEHLPSRFTPVRPPVQLGPAILVEAHDKELDRKVTLHGLPLEDEWTPTHHNMVDAAAAGHHNYLCQVYDRFEYEGHSWTVLPRLGGESLDRILALRGPRNLSQTAELVAKVAEVLDALIQIGKDPLWACPSNILITNKGPVLAPLQLAPCAYELRNVEASEASVYALGRLIQDCLREPNGTLPNIPRQMDEILQIE